MNWDRLKNRMQEEASQQEVKIDVDDIWAAIEPEVDVINQERRKKKFFFFWLFGLGLVLVLSGIYFMIDKNTPDPILVDFEKMEKTTSEHAHEHAHSHAHSHDSQADDIKKETEQNTEAKDEQTISHNQNNSAKDFSKTDKAINFQKNTQSTVAVQEQIVKDILPWKISQSDQKAKPINELVDSDLVFSKSQNDKSDASNQVTDKIIGKELLDVVNPLSSGTLNLQTTEQVLLPENNISNYYTALTKEEIERILSEREDKQKYRTPKFTFSLGLMGGIGKAPNNLNTKSDSISSLLLIRRETESSLETNQVGLTFSFRHQSGLSLSSGLQQTTMVEKVTFDDTVTEVKMIDGVTEIIVSNGDSTYVYGMIPETTITEIEKRQYVRYKLLEVPLILGWQTKDRNNTGWTFGVETGVVPNISLTTKGIIFDENYGDVNLASDQASYFKKNIGMSYHLGFSVRRMLFDNVELSFKPTVRFFPNDFSADGNPISQKYNLVSGQVGVNYIFGN